jgi:hypothetical protein
MIDDPKRKPGSSRPPSSSPPPPKPASGKPIGSTSDADPEAGEGHKGPRTEESSEPDMQTGRLGAE